MKTIKTCPDCGAISEWEEQDFSPAFPAPTYAAAGDHMGLRASLMWVRVGGVACDCASLREQAEIDANQLACEREQAARATEDARLGTFAGPPLDCWSEGLQDVVDCSAIFTEESYEGAGDGTPWGRRCKLGRLVNAASASNLPRVRRLLDGSGVLWNAGPKEVRLSFWRRKQGELK